MPKMLDRRFLTRDRDVTRVGVVLEMALAPLKDMIDKQIRLQPSCTGADTT